MMAKDFNCLYELFDFCTNWLECCVESLGSSSISKVSVKTYLTFKSFARIFGKQLHEARVSYKWRQERARDKVSGCGRSPGPGHARGESGDKSPGHDTTN